MEGTNNSGTDINSLAIIDWLDFIEKKTAPDKRHGIETLLESSEDARYMLEGVKKVYDDHESDRIATLQYFSSSTERVMQRVEAQKEVRMRKTPVSMLLPIGIAASLLLAGFFVWQNFSVDNYQQLALQELDKDAFPAPGSTRGNNSANTDWQKSYASGNFAEAARQLKSDILSASSSNPEAYFYAGLSFLQQQPADPEQAMVYLGNPAVGESVYAQQSLWYLALASLLLEKPEQAEMYLQQSLQQDRPYKQQQTRELLEKISASR